MRRVSKIESRQVVLIWKTLLLDNLQYSETTVYESNGCEYIVLQKGNFRR